MRRKRRGSGRDVLIDLTSLLDIMFIILLVVLWGQSNKHEELTKKQAEAEDAKVQAEMEYKLYEQQLEVADTVNQMVWAATVMVPYNEQDVTVRTIQVLKEGEEIERFELVGNHIEDAVAAFKECLIGYIEANGDRPVILSLNDSDEYILYRDEVMVTELFLELSKKYSNVYVRGSVSGEAK